MNDYVIVHEADPDLAEWVTRENAAFPPPPIREIAGAYFACLDAHPEFADLMRAPMPGAGVPYTPSQESAVREGLAAAHVHGDTRFGKLSFRFHAAALPLGARGLATGVKSAGVVEHVRIDLVSSLDFDALRRVALHELGHASDYFSGVVFPADVMEERAEAFTVAVCLFAGWGLP